MPLRRHLIDVLLLVYLRENDVIKRIVITVWKMTLLYETWSITTDVSQRGPELFCRGRACAINYYTRIIWCTDANIYIISK